MTYPDYDTYTKLYGRYLKKGPEKFFAKMLPQDKRILDLCSGGGQLAQFALDNGASFVLMVDSCSKMIDPDFKGMGRANYVESDVKDFLAVNKVQFDIGTCRQAINYWFPSVSGEQISNAITKGGMFVFNTFGNKPSETPTVREYYHEGVAYKELSYLIGNKVHHVQAATGIPPHVTVFDWIDRQEYIDKLCHFFRLEEVTEGPSSMWYCTKL